MDCVVVVELEVADVVLVELGVVAAVVVELDDDVELPEVELVVVLELASPEVTAATVGRRIKVKPMIIMATPAE